VSEQTPQVGPSVGEEEVHEQRVSPGTDRLKELISHLRRRRRSMRGAGSIGRSAGLLAVMFGMEERVEEELMLAPLSESVQGAVVGPVLGEEILRQAIRQTEKIAKVVFKSWKEFEDAVERPPLLIVFQGWEGGREVVREEEQGSEREQRQETEVTEGRSEGEEGSVDRGQCREARDRGREREREVVREKEWLAGSSQREEERAIATLQLLGAHEAMPEQIPNIQPSRQEEMAADPDKRGGQQLTDGLVTQRIFEQDDRRRVSLLQEL
jgi:hypothetical protein